MCGIAGLLHYNGRAVDTECLDRMIGMLSHRGPDASGVHAEGGAGLAHARLSIIDLAGGSQPMSNEDGTVWISFNGEIFNFLELREMLIERGHRFATRSDTEVLVHLYEDEGEDCVRRLNGQWAFAIWDARRQSLFLSRDRAGVRPLFYTVTGGTFVFGSEIKAIFAYPEVSREMAPEALDEIFTFWCTVPPRTAFKGIRELPAGHSLVVRNGEVSVKQHWAHSYPAGGSWTQQRTEDDYAAELFEMLVDATRIRLRSDVPVGAYLSGGLDSTITTALVRRFTDARLRTFSVTFDDGEFDERAYQREAVRFLETDHQEICCTEDDIGRVFPDVIWHTEQPVLRTAPAPMYLLSKLVREAGYKVVLTGEGADEMFGGYDIFKEAKIRRFWMARPESAMRPRLLRKLYPYLQNVQAQPDAYLRAFFGISSREPGPFFSHEPRWDLTSKIKLFFSPEVRAQLSGSRVPGGLEQRLPAGYGGWHPFCQAQYLEAGYLLPGYILSSQGDRVAMAHSVEGRYPFLDYRVMEFAAKLPPHLKMKVLNEKYLLKRAMKDHIPPAIRKRPKQPYRAPEGRSFFTRSARAWVEDLLRPERLRQGGLFHAPAVEKLVQKFRQGEAPGIKDNMALVGIVSTQLVAEQFIDGFDNRRDSAKYCAGSAGVR